MPRIGFGKQMQRRLGALLTALALVLLSAPAPVASQAAPAGSVQISITDAGFQPASASIAPGDAVHWTNLASTPQSVTADDGAFDSGTLAPGDGFSLALGGSGTHAYHSTTHPAFSGSLHVLAPGLAGPGGDLAAAHIPAIDFPPLTDADIGRHPRIGALMARTHILLGFTATATVGQANAALQAARVTIIGGLPGLGTLLVAAADTPDFSGLDTAIQSLRADPSVNFASRSQELVLNEVPPAAESAITAPRVLGLNWNWGLTPSPTGGPLGDGGNWGLEASRFPQAWNLLETIRRTSPHIDIGIVDGAFEFGHSDLPALTSDTLCTSILHKCTQNDRPNKDHGNHVAGIIGADFDGAATAAGRTRGVSGSDPFAQMHGVPLSFGDGLTAKLFLDETLVEVWNLVLAQQETGANWRVINHSAGHRIADVPLADLESIGKVFRTLAERAAKDGVVIVQSAGNDSSATTLIQAQRDGSFTWAAANWTSSLPNPIITVEASGNADPTAIYGSGFQAADQHRAVFSNVGGDVSAPGTGIASTGSSAGDACWIPGPGGAKVDTRVFASGSAYCLLSGTSMAAPYVTGLAGYLLAYQSDLTPQQVRNAIIAWARPDTFGAAPRIDAFASLLSLPGAAQALVDVNDPSLDGNRRIIRHADGTEVEDRQLSTTSGYRTEPDGKVDMRDFRRFRDAWLQMCVETAIEGDAPAECPSGPDILLDGVPNHPKRDLNFDGCVYQAPADPDQCVTHERVYPRFDFNGDGKLSIADQVPVPLHADGTPADSQADATNMTDLDVLASQWGHGPAASTTDTDGWSAGDLQRLMRSADIEVHTGDFFQAAATDVAIALRLPDTGDSLPVRHLPADAALEANDANFLIDTAPLALASGPTNVEVRGSATVASRVIESFPQVISLLVGQDVRADLCPAMLTLTADRASLTSDGHSQATFTATLLGCKNAPVPGKTITFTQQSSGVQGSLSRASAQTDASGHATTVLTAGTATGQYGVVASLDLGAGHTTTDTVVLNAIPRVTISYVWQETILDWHVDGSNIWTDPTLPDCLGMRFTTSVEDCITSFHMQPDPNLPLAPLRRTGTLVPSASGGFLLTEDADPSLNTFTVSWVIQGIDRTTGQLSSGSGGNLGVTLHDAFTTQVWSADTDPFNFGEYAHHRYASFPVAGVTSDDTAPGIRLSGLRTIGELGYRHDYNALWRSGVQWFIDEVQRPPVNAIPPELLLVARGDGSALQYAADTTQPILIPRHADGSFGAYTYCGTVDHDYTAPRGYYNRIRNIDDVSDGTLLGAREWQRSTVFNPNSINDLATIAGQGHVTVQYAFAAVASANGTPAAVSLPNCSSPTPTPTPSPTPTSTPTPTPGASPTPTPAFTMPSATATRILTPASPVPAAPSAPTLTPTPSADVLSAAAVGQPQALELAQVQSVPPSPAFVIAPANPHVGQTVTITNRSRDGNGQPLGALLDPGNGSGAITLTAGSSTQVVFGSPGNLVVQLTATGSSGASLSVSRPVTVTASADFSIGLSPATQQLAPGTTASVVVSLIGINGFNAPLTLSVGALPTGLSAQFAPSTVTPSGVSILTLTAAASTPQTTFDLNVTATGGGLTHTTTSTTTVNFGLVPVCFGTLGGQVSNSTTHQPLGGVVVNIGSGQTTTGPDGRYVLSNLQLATNNGPVNEPVVVIAPDYWTAAAHDLVSCGAATTQDFPLLSIQYATISGAVTDFDTGVPVPGATIGVCCPTIPPAPATTADDGTYQVTRLRPGDQNTAATYSVAAAKSGYWSTNQGSLPNSVTVQPGGSYTLSLRILRQCTGSISGTVTLADTGQPVGAGVNVVVPLSATGFAKTDAAGHFTIPGLLLDVNNVSKSYTVSVNASGTDVPNYQSASQAVTLSRCGDNEVVALALAPNPVARFATLQGHILDAETGLTVAGIQVFLSGAPFASQPSDASGAYSITTIPIPGGQTNVFTTASISATDTYYSANGVTLLVTVGQPTTLDFHVLRKRFGHIVGTVRDAATHQPLAHVNVNVPGAAPTAADGTYSSGPIPLGANQPTPVLITASLVDYWQPQQRAVALADQTVTVDFDMIRICRDVSIVGSVVSAATGQPIAGATLSFGLLGVQFFETQSDAAGHFAFVGLHAGTDNTPALINILAEANGFQSETRAVTVFCGAAISIDFGQTGMATGTIVGTVTNLDARQPLAGAFVGSEFGGSTTTDALGQYTLTRVPLAAGGADRSWRVTVAPAGFGAQTQTVTVTSATPAHLNFGFTAAGAPTPTPTSSGTSTSTPVATTTPTPAATPTETASPTATPSPAATATPTLTETAGPTLTPTPAATATPTPSATLTLTPTATAVGTPIPTRVGSLQVDGATGYAEVPSAADLNRTGDWTVEAWFKDEDPNGFNHPRRTILSKGDTSLSSEVPYLVQVGDNNIIAGLRTGGQNYLLTWDLNALGLRPQSWHHVAVTFNASLNVLNLWLDGKHLSYLSVPAHTAVGNALPLDIGRKGPATGNYWQGKLDDVRIWNVARTGTEITAHYRSQFNGPQPGLVANWHFDLPNAAIASDSSGNQHSATLAGGAAIASDVHP